ncbi:uncharacterized protein Z520_02860 [Fonsecaea multimorphosa CBS 102226]|uniref:Uncharacterized protein n=1 Tax=Fonsecaea multimorphosa CBS 102226 TaxID=1442371 RepID=A0A0D2K656_9EURO|nr:uncharacterized protein Z520_02860 [Fonsecaea multimorphosa CBS 102226]KIY01308.1 hypothetical protein Z520_02860 [Fonsecaea multimorphosa CBS 102226]OAL28585.1 hypothetical protein AYO22_02779 [Fonsecaea multimorphosa]
MPGGGSPLADAVSWLAIYMMGTCSKGKPYALESGLLARVIKSVRQAIADALASLKDETLSAVMLLEFGEYLFGRRHGAAMLPPMSHQRGAEALIRKRGGLNFKDHNALTLLAAVRNNAVNLALDDGKGTVNWDLWSIQADIERLGQSCTPAMQLDAHATSVVALRAEFDRESALLYTESVQIMRERLVELLSRLSLWEYQAPKDWTPHKANRFQHCYPSQDIAYLFIQYYLLRFETIQLMQELNARVKTPDRSGHQFNHAKDVVNNIVAAEASLLTKGKPSVKECLETCPDRVAGMPQATIQQCLASTRGARLLGKVLTRLENDLRRALTASEIPKATSTDYSVYLNWVRRERQTITDALGA